MKPLAAILLAFALCPALAQPGPGHGQGMRPMPPPERRMNWEERQRLREEVRSGNMTREEAREHWRAQRERRRMEPGKGGFSPEQRQQLRRDVQEANRDLEKR